jgi:hydrogenase nickel incorporation protein HypA/HybF
MHEWALAEAVIAKAVQEATNTFAKVTEIHLQLGELQHIEREIFESALREILSTAEPIVKDAQVKLELTKAAFACRACQHQWQLDRLNLSHEISEAIHFLPEMSLVYLRCPQCQSPDFEIISGRGLWLASLHGVH